VAEADATAGPQSTSPFLPPYAGLTIAVLSVSFAAPLFRLADAPAITASFWRLAFAVVLLLPFAWRSAPAWRRYSVRDGLATFASGIALGAHFGLWVTSLFLTTVASSVALVTLQAVLVALGSHFLLRERLTRRGWTGVMVATVGALTIAGTDGLTAPDSGRVLLGDLLAFLGAFGSAAYFLIGRRLRQRHDLVTYVVPVYAIAALALTPFLLLTGQPIGADITDTQFVYFVLLAAVPMLGGHTLANWCMRYLPAHTVATWILLEPAGAALLAWPLLGEVPHAFVAAGGVLVLVGAWRATTAQRHA
jgi:drug/metabolite transporter (DMT)-like permease